MYHVTETMDPHHPRVVGLILLMVATCASGFVLAADDPFFPFPITANEAFDVYATQTDLMGQSKSVALVDVRTRAEYYWVGTPTQVEEIKLKNGSSIYPDDGKVLLDHEGKFLTYSVDGRNKRLQVNKVDKLTHSPIAINIPYKLWNEETATSYLNPDFEDDVNALATEEGVEVVILYCRTGGRSSGCVADFDTTLFHAVYEIDDPGGKKGRGGFEGNAYKEAFNGYLGFPGRQTSGQETPSVSWKDSGLPMKTLVSPLPE